MRKFKAILMTALVVSLVAVPLGSAMAAGEIKLGTIFSRTGSLANLGLDSWRGAELARIVQNQKGGLLGKKIVFINGDAPNPKAAVSETERLATVEKVPIILGSFSSSISLAASAKANQHKVIYWELGAVGDKITERGLKYVFRTCPTGSDLGRDQLRFALGELAKKIGKKPAAMRVASIYEDSAYGTACASGIRAQAKDMGIKLAMDESYNHKATDLSSLVMRIKAAKPDVILESSYENDAIMFFRQAQEAGLKVRQFVGSGGGMNMPGYNKALGSSLTGYVCNVGYPGYNLNPAYAKGIKELEALYVKTFGEKPNSVFSVINYMGTMALWNVIERAGSMDPKALVKAARATDISGDNTLLRYGIKFAPAGAKNMGQNVLARYFISQWQDGKLWIVSPAAAATPGRSLQVK
ncbi:MAG: ABC transporter substrate-binding protein [Desulfarculaceae bacterium]|nr:ABC transporter substrate-binding protein [Desulfarculaceae bacterium]MCF8073232.1 ABC transporter substrate-binding protein [Desulfarculaceae bacterium]MCF8100828.1 ABC transporter substrate-binding protein [Desulfarculaceae bacterium]MCF8118202.1 ABC transporter substrate-binding protein [Desulfarculaceae bacterium]